MTEHPALAPRLLARFAAELAGIPSRIVEETETAGEAGLTIRFTKGRVPITFEAESEAVLSDRVAQMAKLIAAEADGRSLLMARLPHPVTVSAEFPEDDAGHVARLVRAYVITNDDYAYAFDVLYSWE